MQESKNIINNFFWRLAERFGAQIVTFIVSLVLARLLDPEVYGVLALVMVFTSILQVFVDSGLGTALVQKKDADDLDFSSVFFFNTVVCVILYLLVFLAAPYIAQFYKMSELTSVVRVLGLILIISGIKNIQQSYVSRYLMFKRFFFATLGGTIGAAIVGIWMAQNGFGVWALATQYLFNASVDTLILWITVRWRPKWMFSFERLKGLLSFGWKLLGVSLLSTVYNDIRSLIIGKLYTANDLAYYNKAQQFPQLIATNVDTSIDSVLLPTMSQKQDDRATIKQMARLSIKMGTYVIMPIMVGLAVCCEPLIRIILTEKWLPCVPYLRIFCFTFAFFSVFTTNYNAYKALGRSDVYLKVTVFTKVTGIVVLLSTMWFGVIWIAYGLIATNVINQVICSTPSKRLFDYRYSEQLKDILPNLSISVIMGAIVYCVGFFHLSDWVTILIQIVVGAASYIGLSVVTKNNNFRYLLKKIKGFRKGSSI